MVAHMQAVDTRLLSLLPCSLGRRLIIDVHTCLLCIPFIVMSCYHGNMNFEMTDAAGHVSFECSVGGDETCPHWEGYIHEVGWYIYIYIYSRDT